MRNLLRNRRKLYICELYEENGIRKYKEPVELKVNWQMTNNSAEFGSPGQEIYDHVRIKTHAKNAKYYHFGDRAYVFTEVPSEYDILAKEADYEVMADPIVTLNECHVMLKKLSGRNASKNIY